MCVCVYIHIFFLRATPAAYGSFQARDGIRAAAASYSHSHNHTRYEPHL